MHPSTSTPSHPGTVSTADLGTTFDEPRTRSLLAGDQEQVTLALALIDRHLRRTMSLWLRRRLPRLRDDDRADVWADTLVAVLKAARRGRFHGERPLLPWLCRIAYLRAVDHLRHRTAWENFLLHHPRHQEPQSALPLIEQDESALELRALIEAFVPTLPATQCTALAVFLQHWPHSRATAVLHREVVRLTGQATTPAAVKRAMQVGRGKLRRFLSEHGYETPLDGDAPPCQVQDTPAPLLMQEDGCWSDEREAG